MLPGGCLLTNCMFIMDLYGSVCCRFKEAVDGLAYRGVPHPTIHSDDEQCHALCCEHCMLNTSNVMHVKQACILNNQLLHLLLLQLPGHSPQCKIPGGWSLFCCVFNVGCTAPCTDAMA